MLASGLPAWLKNIACFGSLMFQAHTLPGSFDVHSLPVLVSVHSFLLLLIFVGVYCSSFFFPLISIPTHSYIDKVRLGCYWPRGTLHLSYYGWAVFQLIFFWQGVVQFFRGVAQSIALWFIEYLSLLSFLSVSGQVAVAVRFLTWDLSFIWKPGWGLGLV